MVMVLVMMVMVTGERKYHESIGGWCNVNQKGQKARPVIYSLCARDPERRKKQPQKGAKSSPGKQPKKYQEGTKNSLRKAQNQPYQGVKNRPRKA